MHEPYPRLLMVTGASGGVAQAVIAQALAQGDTVIAVSRHEAPSVPSAAGLSFVQADVSTAEGADHALQAAMEQHGRAPDALCHAAGNLRLGPIERVSDAAWSEVLRGNLDSSFYTLRAWIRARGDQPGVAVLFSSVAARMGTSNHVAVAAAKGGIEAMVRALAADLAPRGSRINALALGLTDTPLAKGFLGSERSRQAVTAQYPLGRIGTAEEIAQQALWLLSPVSGWITGQVLPVDGGFSAVRPLVKT